VREELALVLEPTGVDRSVEVVFVLEAVGVPDRNVEREVLVFEVVIPVVGRSLVEVVLVTLDDEEVPDFVIVRVGVEVELLAR
jgi:hypothetical protein